MRNLVTTLSFDIDQPGLSPWAIPPGSAANYNLPLAGSYFPSGGAAAFPTNRNTPPSGEFGPDWRAIDAALGRVNLNRALTPYTATTIDQADRDRQQLAADIFIRLVAVTGVYDIFNPIDPNTGMPRPIGQQQFNALRWLAQLAANIVDYVDSDDVMTLFNWANPTSPVYANYYLPQAYPQFQTAISQFQTAAQNFDTPAPAGKSPVGGSGWVIGTELPRVVVNEAYAEYKFITPAPPTPPKPGTQYTVQVDVWAELHNPFNTDLPGADPANPGGSAFLYNPTAVAANRMGQQPSPVYQLVLADTTSANLRMTGNVGGNIVGSAGDTIYPTTTTAGGPQCIVQFPPPTQTTIPPPGYFLVGPAAAEWKSPNFTAQPNASFQTPAWPQAGLTYQLKLTAPATGAPPAPPPPTILLQRLTNPYAAANVPGTATYNASVAPNVYVTVDYMEGGTLPPRTNPGIQWSVQDTSKATPANKRFSFGRIQPYTGAKTQVQQQPTINPPPAMATANTTFYLVNSPVNNPFNWLVHLDRQLISPMELLNVSAFMPHELTQQFNAQMYPTESQIPAAAVPGTTQSFYGHRAPWFDEDQGPGSGNSHLLYRLFEFLETGNRAAGMTPGGRIPGNININTIYDQQEVLQALCAALAPNSNPNPNYFDTNSVSQIFNQLIAFRSPGLQPPPLGDGTLHATANSGITLPPGQQPDQPLASLAAAFSTGDLQYPAGTGINNTLLRAGPLGALPRLFQVTSFGSSGTPPTPTQVTHPYLQDQLITKVFNNLTTRSNVFAVFLTVGFFQVIQDTDPATGQPVRPVKLGAEIGKAENRHIRHRMFAIVDRTNLATDKYNPNTIQPPPVFISGTVPYPPPPAGPAPYTIAIPDGQYFAMDPVNGQPSVRGSYEGIPWVIQGPYTAAGGSQVLGSNILIDTGVNQELVNVNAPPAAGQPPTITYAATPKAHAGPVAVTPVNTVTGYTAITANGAVPLQLQASATNGVFQGSPWSFKIGTNFLIDPGTQQEIGVIVATPPGQPALFQCATTPTGQFTQNHPGPYTISYPYPVGGNPGPQTNFDIRQVPWVVRHFSIIN
jgi:hypothetical protein